MLFTASYLVPERKPVNPVISSVAPALARQNLENAPERITRSVFDPELRPKGAREKSIIHENIGVTDFSLWSK
jgi:hypothetical protein